MNGPGCDAKGPGGSAASAALTSATKLSPFCSSTASVHAFAPLSLPPTAPPGAAPPGAPLPGAASQPRTPVPSATPPGAPFPGVIPTGTSPGVPSPGVPPPGAPSPPPEGTTPISPGNPVCCCPGSFPGAPPTLPSPAGCSPGAAEECAQAGALWAAVGAATPDEVWQGVGKLPGSCRSAWVRSRRSSSPSCAHSSTRGCGPGDVM